MLLSTTDQQKSIKKPTSASAGLQDANPTIQPYADAPNCECPPSHCAQFQLPHCDFYIAHPGSNATAVTPREPNFTKMGEAHCGSCRTSMQSFTPLSFSAIEKFVTVHTK